MVPVDFTVLKPLDSLIDGDAGASPATVAE